MHDVGLGPVGEFVVIFVSAVDWRGWYDEAFLVEFAPCLRFGRGEDWSWG